MHNKNRPATPRRQTRPTNHNRNGNAALRNVQQLSLQRRKPKALDDDIRENTQPANDQRTTQLQQNIQPNNRVCERLEHLIFLKLLILDARVVCAHALDHQPFVVFAEAFGFHGAVGEVPAQEEPPCAGCGAQNEEEQLPGFDVVADVVACAPGEDSADLFVIYQDLYGG
jgi:hypothetical protein